MGPKRLNSAPYHLCKTAFPISQCVLKVLGSFFTPAVTNMKNLPASNTDPVFELFQLQKERCAGVEESGLKSSLWFPQDLLLYFFLNLLSLWTHIQLILLHLHLIFTCVLLSPHENSSHFPTSEQHRHLIG